MGRDRLPVALGLVLGCTSRGEGRKWEWVGCPGEQTAISAGALASPALHQRNPHVDAGEGHHTQICVDFLKKFISFFSFWPCWVFAAVRGLSVVAARGGSSLVVVHGLLFVVGSRLQSTGSRCVGVRGCTVGSAAVAHGSRRPTP